MRTGRPDIQPRGGSSAEASATEHDRSCKASQTLRLKRPDGPFTTYTWKVRSQPWKFVCAMKNPRKGKSLPEGPWRRRRAGNKVIWGLSLRKVLCEMMEETAPESSLKVTGSPLTGMVAVQGSVLSDTCTGESSWSWCAWLALPIKSRLGLRDLGVADLATSWIPRRDRCFERGRGVGESWAARFRDGGRSTWSTRISSTMLWGRVWTWTESSNSGLWSLRS